jgi:hypothetical protein
MFSCFVEMGCFQMRLVARERHPQKSAAVLDIATNYGFLRRIEVALKSKVDVAMESWRAGAGILEGLLHKDSSQGIS